MKSMDIITPETHPITEQIKIYKNIARGWLAIQQPIL